MFSLICVWINYWVNNREAGDLRRYRAHYDFIVMTSREFTSVILNCVNWQRTNGNLMRYVTWFPTIWQRNNEHTPVRHATGYHRPRMGFGNDHHLPTIFTFHWGMFLMFQLMIIQQWFRQWLGVVRQQAVILFNAGLDSWHHMTSSGHHEFLGIYSSFYHTVDYHRLTKPAAQSLVSMEVSLSSAKLPR